MSVSYAFFAGFLTALLLVAAVLFGLYFYSSRKRANLSVRPGISGSYPRTFTEAAGKGSGDSKDFPAQDSWDQAESTT